MANLPLIKQPAESRLYDFDLENLFSPAETISSVSGVSQSKAGVATTDLTLGTPSHDSAHRVQVRISGGVVGDDYTVTATVTTSRGDTVEADGILKIRDLPIE